MNSNWTERLPDDELPGRAGQGVVSPCVRNCCLDDKDICLGCGRSLAEILEWSGANDERRRAIGVMALERVGARQNRLAQKGKP